MRRAPWLGLLLAALPAMAGAELQLVDGRTLKGESVERKGSLYLLSVEGDAVLPIPIDLVRRVRLTGDAAPAASGMRPAVARTLVGQPDGPKLADTPEQLGVFSKSNSPRSSAVDVISPAWRPGSGQRTPADVTEFNPVRWYRAPIDPNWQPTSAFKQQNDVTEFSPARWYQAPLPATWWPRDGFQREPEWFAPVVPPRR